MEHVLDFRVEYFTNQCVEWWWYVLEVLRIKGKESRLILAVTSIYTLGHTYVSLPSLKPKASLQRLLWNRFLHTRMPHPLIPLPFHYKKWNERDTKGFFLWGGGGRVLKRWAKKIGFYALAWHQRKYNFSRVHTFHVGAVWIPFHSTVKGQN